VNLQFLVLSALSHVEDGQTEMSSRRWNIRHPAKCLALIVADKSHNTFIMSTTPKPAFNLEDLSNSFGSKNIPQEIAVKVESDDGESGKLSSSTALHHTLLGFNQVGMAFVIKKVVKDELWHNVKFIIDNDELDFNDEPATICSYMVEKCNVKPEHSKLWWTKVAKK
jgi:hypothetical protein